MIPLGQFRDTFIIAIDDEGIAIIDQHVAHERVLFEQAMERLTSGPLESQRLLTPVLIEMSPGERQSLIPHAATLEKFVLEIEEFGRDAVRLSAVPAALDPSECEAAIRRSPATSKVRSRIARRGGLAPDCRDDGVPCRREGELPADDGEDAVHSRGTAADSLLERLSSWQAGGAANHTAGD
jgi:hypothetical protein